MVVPVLAGDVVYRARDLDADKHPQRAVDQERGDVPKRMRLQAERARITVGPT